MSVPPTSPETVVVVVVLCTAFPWVCAGAAQSLSVCPQYPLRLDTQWHSTYSQAVSRLSFIRADQLPDIYINRSWNIFWFRKDFEVTLKPPLFGHKHYRVVERQQQGDTMVYTTWGQTLSVKYSTTNHIDSEQIVSVKVDPSFAQTNLYNYDTMGSRRSRNAVNPRPPALRESTATHFHVLAVFSFTVNVFLRKKYPGTNWSSLFYSVNWSKI